LVWETVWRRQTCWPGLRRSALCIATLAVTMQHDPKELVAFFSRHYSSVAVLDDSQVPRSAVRSLEKVCQSTNALGRGGRWLNRGSPF
jgi:hypothetical protein